MLIMARLLPFSICNTLQRCAYLNSLWSLCPPGIGVVYVDEVAVDEDRSCCCCCGESVWFDQVPQDHISSGDCNKNLVHMRTFDLKDLSCHRGC